MNCDKKFQIGKDFPSLSLKIYVIKNGSSYSHDKSRADISPRLFQGYWATAYLPVAYC